MANYPYIIASFPDLLLDYERHALNVEAVVDEVKSQLSEKDGKLVDWLTFGMEGSHLTPHFYRNIRQTRCHFLIDWFGFDRKLRLAKVAFLEGKPVQEEFDETTTHIRQLLKTKLIDLDLSVRALNCLKAAEVDTLGDLVSFNKADLLKFRNFGKKSLTELENLVASKNLEFGMNVAKYKLDKE